MRHLFTSASALALVLALPGMAAAQDAGWMTTVTKEAGIGASDFAITDLMNFKNCAKFEWKPVGKIGRCGGSPAPVVRFTYQEPVAVVEVTCKAGESTVAGKQSLMGGAVGKILSAAVETAVGQQKCQEHKSQTNGGFPSQWYFETHVFGVTWQSKLQASLKDASKFRLAALTSICNLPAEWQKPSVKNVVQMFNGLTNAAHAAVSGGAAAQMTMGGVTSMLPWGLPPSFLSEAARPTWQGDELNPATALNTAAFNAGGGMGSILCSANALGQDAGSALESVGIPTADIPNLMGGFDTSVCVGSWGTANPQVGFNYNKIRPVAAALVGYRGYKYALGLAALRPEGFQGVRANTHGTQQFNLDYPFINDTNPFADHLVGGLGAKGGHRGSGCYNIGTVAPNWYTQGESLVTDPLQFAAKMLDPAQLTGAKVNASNGDYVFTYWKNTSCDVNMPCLTVKKYHY